MGKRYRVTLTGEERGRLEELISRGKAAARKLTHARILLHADRSAAGPGWQDARVADAVQMSVRSVERVRRRFVEAGLEAAQERKPSLPVYARKLDGAGEAHLIALACSDPPQGRKRWGLRLLADQEVRPPRRGRVARDDSEYVRHGTANLLGPSPLAGQRRVRATDQRRRDDVAHFVRDLIDGQCPDAERIVLVMDQLNTHGLVSLYEAFPPREARRWAERVEIHHTPKHGSWLNMAEIELSVLRRDLPERIARKETLDPHVQAWQDRRNVAAIRADARIKLCRLYPTIEP